jgi:hypothetical protein
MNASGKQMVALLFIIGLAACSSGSVGSTPAEPALPTQAPPARATTLYVAAGQVPGSLASIGATARGTLAPATLIQGSTKNDLAFNFFDWYDAHSGLIWATNCLSLSSQGPVEAFKASATGPVAPAVSIGGSKTGLSSCQLGITMDGLGNLFVADISNTKAAPGGHVAIFRPGQNGNVAPNHAIVGAAANFHSPTGVAVDSSGNLYVADSCQGYSCSGDIQVFAAGSNGNVASIRTITGAATGIAGPEGLALDAAGDLYVANAGTNAITVYAPGATGNAAPIRTIAGSKTRLDAPCGVALDGLGYLYVGTEDGQQPAGVHLPVLVFAPNAKGDAAPVSTITFNTESLAVPSGVALK